VPKMLAEAVQQLIARNPETPRNEPRP